MLLVILLYALFASFFSLAKSTLSYSEPFFLVGSRMLCAGIMLLTYQLIWKPKIFSIIKANHVKILVLLSLFMVYLTNIAEIWGMQHMVSAKACLIYSLSPFIAALVAYFVLREVLSLKKWIGLITGFVGLIPIFMTNPGVLTGSQQHTFFSLPELVVVLAVFFSVFGWILLKKLINEYNYTPLLANGISMTLGGVLALLHSYFSGESWNPIPVNNFWPFIHNSILMCLISNIICYNLYGYLLKRFSATFMSFAGLITPLFASFFGWFFLKEHITWHFFVSMGLFSMGLIIFYQEELKPKELVQNKI